MEVRPTVAADIVVMDVLGAIREELFMSPGALSDFSRILRLAAMEGFLALARDQAYSASHPHPLNLHLAFLTSWDAAVRVLDDVDEVVWCRLEAFLGALRQDDIPDRCYPSGPVYIRRVSLLTVLGLEVLRQRRAMRAPTWEGSATWIDRVLTLFRERSVA